jgi:RimJ/RimL family protein N-acetyltransferase
MQHDYMFEYRHIQLRPLCREDIESLRKLRNQNLKFFLNSNYITAEQQMGWFNRYLEKNDDLMFAVELRKNPGVFIGAISLYNVDHTLKEAECGRTVIDKDKAPIKGIGTETTVAVCQIGFLQLGLKKITGTILKSNPRILKVDTRAGFIVAGETEDCYKIKMTPETIQFFPEIEIE